MGENERPFYFESDHLALKENTDYKECLKLLVLLEAQRSKALKDIDLLLETEREAMTDPITFVKDLQSGNISLPHRQDVAPLPEIDWSKYSSDLGGSSRARHKHTTRNSVRKVIKIENNDGSDSSVKRKQDNHKTETFNKPWSVSEQRLLEELLVKYPPEQIEARRWEKIANELPNRDPKQVQSRVQKYFIKLAKAGLPVPGRLPNMRVHTTGRPKYAASTRLSMYYSQPSTFLQRYEQPVFMKLNDEEMTREVKVNTCASNAQASLSESEDSDDDAELQQLCQERRERMEERGAVHHGFQCDACGDDPILGTRYHCVDCPSDVSTDYCAACRSEAVEDQSSPHRRSHRLHPFAVAYGHSDTDYGSSTFSQSLNGGYNYLDPNYEPAT